MGRRLLVCADTRPWPPDRGDRVRYAHFVDALREDHEVRLALVRRASEASVRPALDEIDVLLPPRRVAVNGVRGLASRVPLQFSAFDDRAAAAALREAAAECDAFVALGARAGLYRSVFGGRGPAILDLQDSLVLNARAQWKGARGLARKLYGADNLLKAAGFERRLVHAYDLVLVAGARDHEWVRARYPRARCALVPTAVALPAAPPPPPAAEPRLLFLGDLRFAPNADAVRYLLDDIWPRIRELHPAAILRVVGHAPERSLARKLAAQAVETAYSVPDVAPHVAAARAVLAPMRVGSGVKVKVLEAMAAARPVVMTPLANDGVGATDGVEARVAERPEELAAAAAGLLRDPAAALRIGNAGRDLAAARFSPGAVTRTLLEAIDGVLGGDGGGRD